MKKEKEALDYLQRDLLFQSRQPWPRVGPQPLLPSGEVTLHFEETPSLGEALPRFRPFPLPYSPLPFLFFVPLLKKMKGVGQKHIFRCALWCHAVFCVVPFDTP